jgi:DNA repair protein SbcD/Mre11
VFRFIHSGDLHLDSPLKGIERYDGAPVDELQRATRRALENLVALAIDERVAFVVLAGDVFDSGWKDYHTGLYFAAQMSKLRDAGIAVIMIAGNHDSATGMTLNLRMPDNVTLLSTRNPETKTLDDYPVAVHGQGYPTRAVSYDLTAGYPAALPELFNIGLLHTSLDGRAGHDPYAPCSLNGLRAKRYDYWALGHIHKRETVAKDPWVVFSGNLQGRHIGETGSKGCTLVTVDHDAVLRVEHRDLSVVRWVNLLLDVSAESTLDDVYERIMTAIDEAMSEAENRLLAVRLELSGQSPLDGRIRSLGPKLINEVRQIATDATGGRSCVEQICVRTATMPGSSLSASAEESLGGLLQTLTAPDDHDVFGRSSDIESLRLRLLGLPGVADDLATLFSPEERVRALEDAKQLVIEALRRNGDAP